MFKKSLFIVSLFSFLFFLCAFTISNSPLIENALAQGGIMPAATGNTSCTGPNASASYCGDYQVNDFVTLAINIAQLILGLVGSLSLIMFVYGGVMFLISAGSSDKIAQAKKILVAAVVGLIIVFSSWLIIKFVSDTLGAQGDYKFNGTVSVE